MKKKLLGLALMSCATVALASCGGNKVPEDWKVDDSGKVLNIYAWNTEFKLFFEKYVSDQKVPSVINDATNPNAPAKYTLDGLEVKWTITPSDGGQYQTAVDAALKAQSEAKAEDRLDMFLAEADYIQKYSDSDYTQDITTLGVTNMDNVYNYTKQAASNSKGVVKGVSFQCCPSALIYNRVVAKAVWGTDDPATIQTKLSTWDKFDEAAVACKAKGYYMLASEADSYRVFSNNASSAWVDGNKNLTIPDTVEQWMDQADRYIKKGYTVASDVWGEDKVANIKADENKALCCFGPAWYYNFCMGSSKAGDWAICEGPMAHFWGGTWLMAPAGSDNTTAVAKIMDAFINDKSVCENLIKKDGQFTNNQEVNASVANAADYKGNAFLGGQNDTKLFLDLAKNIKFENTTIYDQICNEGLQEKFREYLKGTVTKQKAIENFYTYIKEKYNAINVPSAK